MDLHDLRDSRIWVSAFEQSNATSDDLHSCPARAIVTRFHTSTESTETFLKFSIRATDASPAPKDWSTAEKFSPVPVSIQEPSRRGAGPDTCRVHYVHWILASAGLARKDKHAVVVKPQPDPHGHLGILMVKHLEKTIVIVFEIRIEILLFQVLSCNFYPQTKTWNAGIRFDPPLGSTWQVRPGRRKRRTAQPASGHLSTAASKDMPLHLTLEIALQSSFNMPRSSYNCLTALYIYIYHYISFDIIQIQLFPAVRARDTRRAAPPKTPKRLRPKRRTLHALFGWSRQACRRRLDTAINKNL